MVAAPFGLPAVAAAPKGGADIIILAGQSNTVGLGKGPFTWSTTATNDSRILQVGRFGDQDMKIIPMGLEPLHFWNDNTPCHGFGVSLARKYIKRIAANRSVVIVPAARNGSSVLEWAGVIDDHGLYTDMLARVSAALTFSGTNKIAGWFDQQGETDVAYMNDATSPLHDLMPDPSAYKQRKQALIDRVRSDLGNVPMIFGKMAQGWIPGDPNKVGTETALDDLGSVNPHCRVVSSKGLKGNSVDYPRHFSAAAQETLSGRHILAWDAAHL